jgi:hypothetical protein
MKYEAIARKDKKSQQEDAPKNNRNCNNNFPEILCLAIAIKC